MVRVTKRSQKYILFTGKEHENVKFDFNMGQVETFIQEWNEGKPISHMAKRMGCSKVSAVLLLIDLEIAGKIKPREGGIFGNAS